MFITTANLLDTIPPALRDRMEVIHFPGYTEDEKLHIAQQYLVPKQLEEHGLTPSKLEIADDALQRDHPPLHARGGRAQPRARDRRDLPAGRAQGRRGQEGQDDASPRATLHKYLGPPQVQLRHGRGEGRDRRRRPGSCGPRSAATSSSSRRRRWRARATLILTGQLGDVMRESAQAAVSYIRTRAKDLGIAEDFHEKHRPAHPRARPRRSPRTGRRPASRWRPRSPRCSSAARCGATSR